MTTVFMEQLESGDVIELGRDGDCVTRRWCSSPPTKP